MVFRFEITHWAEGVWTGSETGLRVAVIIMMSLSLPRSGRRWRRQRESYNGYSVDLHFTSYEISVTAWDTCNRRESVYSTYQSAKLAWKDESVTKVHFGDEIQSRNSLRNFSHSPQRRDSRNASWKRSLKSMTSTAFRLRNMLNGINWVETIMSTLF